jgi:hypothetical protein
MAAANAYSQAGNHYEAFDMFLLAFQRDQNAIAGLELAERLYQDATSKDKNGFAVGRNEDIEDVYNLIIQISGRREEFSPNEQTRLDRLRRTLLNEAWINAETVLCRICNGVGPDIAVSDEHKVHFFLPNQAGLHGLAEYQDTSLDAATEMALRFVRGSGTTPDLTEAFRRLSNLLVDPRVIPPQEQHVGIIPIESPKRTEAQDEWNKVVEFVEIKRNEETKILEVCI